MTVMGEAAELREVMMTRLQPCSRNAIYLVLSMDPFKPA
jgi:hypothetical protein